ncbi:UDP-glucuronosyltransferase 1A1-like isoform X2 [Bufo gargarizans]|uniref:UDP-glucuronosyltransferase 1A1-like isoform X2 n=1 Tax=Bufo gargarizans TaxID=30331 RepID=UPI001CF143C7|nr:UDP-glucuronosyltransferase 1A1-like isoform X2 [Bufo gargarizans]
MPSVHLSLVLVTTIVLITSGRVAFVNAGTILVVPVDGSHWLGMRPVVDILIQKGHHAVVLVPEINWHIKTSQDCEVKFYPVSYTFQELHDHFSLFSHEAFTQRPSLEKFLVMQRRMKEGAAFMLDSCARMLNNSQLIQSLEAMTFDAVFTDPMLPCGQILAEHLSLPSVFFLRGIPCNLDAKAAKCPTPLSYVPSMLTSLTDHMSFPQRVKNLFYDLTTHVMCNIVYSPYEQLAKEFLKRDVSLQEILSHAAIWLMRIDFTFEFPKPLMPNMILIGGINCAQKKLLNQDFEKLVNSSGEHGFVVFSLGSMVSEIPMDKAMDMAEAFRSIPQTVIWRYTGKVPSNLGSNTHLVKWLPQNDLLAHPKARAFITHAGSHGIYEGICNAVPMVMLPLFGDQMDNAKRMESRGAGVTLNVLDMTPEDLINALDSVINKPSYKENVQRLSALHLDRPIHPLDLAVHWVEFVMRHKGAPHLRPAAHDLNWIQYHSLDVFAFLLAVLVTTFFISFKCCAYTCRRCCGRKSRPKSKSKKE